MKIFFAGEGSDELGEWARHPAYWPRQGETPEGGVLHALVGRVGCEHSTHGALCWSDIRKFRAGDRRSPETRTVLGLALKAEEREADVLVFVRDRDGDEEREADVESGIKLAAEKFSVPIVGGTANEEIEAWLLAMLGEQRSEERADPKDFLEKRHGVSDRIAKLRIVQKADLGQLPTKCASLKRWLERARTHLIA